MRNYTLYTRNTWLASSRREPRHFVQRGRQLHYGQAGTGYASRGDAIDFIIGREGGKPFRVTFIDETSKP